MNERTSGPRSFKLILCTRSAPPPSPKVKPDRINRTNAHSGASSPAQTAPRTPQEPPAHAQPA